MPACNVHRVPEVGCVDCLQDERDNYRAEVNRLRATLEIAGLEPKGERCVRCSWLGDEVLKKCYPCERIEYLEKLIVRVGQVFDGPDIREGVLIVPHELAGEVLTIMLKHE